MNRHIAILSIFLLALFTLQGCRETVRLEEPPEGRFEMSFKGGTTTDQKQNLIDNSRLFLFGRDGLLKKEIYNLNKTATTVSSSNVPIGDWNIVSVSHLGAVTKDFKLELAYGGTKKQLLYEFAPTVEGEDCPEIVTFSQNITMDVDGQIINSATFTRAVGKVAISIVGVTGNIAINSQNHTVEIFDVPSKLSWAGELLDNSNDPNRAEPTVLVGGLTKKPITIKAPKPSDNTQTDYDYYDKTEFIIPAYLDVTLDGHHETNKKLNVKIKLETTTSGEYYESVVTMVPDKALSANRILYLKVNIKSAIEIETDIIDWGEVLVDGDIHGSELEVPNEVLLGETADGWVSESGDIKYKGKEDVAITVRVGDTDVALSGADEIDLMAGTKYGVPSWMETATWTPTDTKTGKFNFTCDDSQTEIPYKITLKSGNITKVMTVKYMPSAGPSNCYMVPITGKTLTFPAVERVNQYQTDAGAIGDGDQWYAEVIWADFNPTGVNTVTIKQNGSAVYGTGVTEKLEVTLPNLGKGGNVTIGIKKKDATATDGYLWSWHIWITDYDPQPVTSDWDLDKAYSVTGGQVHRYNGTLWSNGIYKNKVIMDRNLGATVKVGDGAAINTKSGIIAYGMYYQKGRKDPFPHATGANTTTIQTWKKDGDVYPTESLWIGTQGTGIPLSVKNPTKFNANDNALGPWADAPTAKSIHDPCPAGWRVPIKDTWRNFGTVSVFGPNFTSGINGGRTYKGTAEGKNVAAWYPASGYRYFSSGALTSVEYEGLSWSSSSSASTAGDMCLYFSSTWIDPNYPLHRAFGFPVRCMQE